MQENCKYVFAVKMSDFSPLFYCIQKNFVITLKAVIGGGEKYEVCTYRLRSGVRKPCKGSA